MKLFAKQLDMDISKCRVDDSTLGQPLHWSSVGNEFISGGLLILHITILAGIMTTTLKMRTREHGMKTQSTPIRILRFTT